MSKSLLLDLLLVAAALLLALWAPARLPARLRQAERRFRRLAENGRAAVALVAVLSLVTVIAVSLVNGVPRAKVHDEFSYLLAADTFAHGRMTNPTHPLWDHFESMHIIQTPSYASKYPPGQGLSLAVGQVLGHPVIGVWLTTVMAALAMYWMLRAWVPPAWALLGGALAALNPFLVYWSHGYWGGSLAVIGGALLLGGLRRFRAAPRARHSLVMALGALILANTRPYEGLVLSLAPFAVLLAWGARGSTGLARFPRLKVLLPGVVVLVVGAVGMGFYNQRVTGNALRFPYLVHDSTYGVRPQLPWLRRANERPVSYRVPEMKNFYEGRSTQQGTPEKPQRWWRKLRVLQRTLTYPVILGVPLLAVAAAVRRDWWARFGLLTLAICILGLLPSLWLWPHYAAPAMPLVLALQMMGLRQLYVCRTRGRQGGRLLVWVVPIASLVTMGAVVLHLARLPRGWDADRARIVSLLERTSGRDLVIVHYSERHNIHDEWVYNEADIDGSEVVWARERDAKSNRRLLRYFSGRCAWVLEADARPPRLRPHPQGRRCDDVHAQQDERRS